MPTQQNVHVDSLLTNLSIAFRQNQTQYIADKVFPVIPVSKQSDLFRTYEQSAWFRDDARERADGVEAAEVDFTMSTTPYYAKVYAARQFLGDQTLANHDAPGDLYQEATNFVTDKLLLRREIQFISDFFGAGIWGYNRTGVASAPSANQFIQWNDYVNSNPITDIEAAKLDIVSTTGMEANTLIFGRQVWPILRNHPDIIDRISGGATNSDPALADLEIIARIFGVQRVLVANTIKTSSNEGQTATYGFNASKGVLLVYAADAPGLMTPSAGYTFAWNSLPNGLSGATVGVKRYRDEARASDIVEAQSAWSNQVIAANLGEFLASAIA
jgi:hypothetical protein